MRPDLRGRLVILEPMALLDLQEPLDLRVQLELESLVQLGQQVRLDLLGRLVILEPMVLLDLLERLVILEPMALLDLRVQLGLRVRPDLRGDLRNMYYRNDMCNWSWNKRCDRTYGGNG